MMRVINNPITGIRHSIEMQERAIKSEKERLSSLLSEYNETLIVIDRQQEMLRQYKEAVNTLVAENAKSYSQ